jgi:hypothetical protein
MYFLDQRQVRDEIAGMGFDWQTIEGAMGPSLDIGKCEVRRTREEFYNSYVAAMEAVAFFGPFTRALLYVHSMGGRINTENGHLLERLRHAYGERRAAHHAPGHAFQAHDQYDLVTFCDIVINYGFQAVLLQHRSRNWVAFTEADEMRFLPEQLN